MKSDTWLMDESARKRRRFYVPVRIKFLISTFAATSWFLFSLWMAEAWMREDLARPVDLARGPLFTEALFTAGPDRLFWYQRAHHIALDGYGFSLIARRVAELYTARVEGRSSEGGAFGSLRRVVDEDLAYRASPDLERDRAFWTQRFADRPEPVSLGG